MFSVIVYFLTNLGSTIEQFLIFTLVMVLAASFGCSLGFLLGCCFDELHVAMQLMGLVTMFPIIYAGLAINLKTVAMFPLGWLQYASAYRYFCEALMWN